MELRWQLLVPNITNALWSSALTEFSAGRQALAAAADHAPGGEQDGGSVREAEAQ